VPELGKCPTCGGKIATVSKVCLHCGERDFIETKREGSRKVVCYDCRGSGSCIVGLEWMLGIQVGEVRGICPACGGTGEVIPSVSYDTRTGRVVSPSLEEQYRYDPIQREEIRRENRVGCLKGVFGLVVAAVIVFWIGRAVGFW